MGKGPYSVDLRVRIVAAVKRRQSQASVARVFGVHALTVSRYMRLDREGRLQEVGRSPGRPAALVAQHEQQLLEQVKNHPDATLQEHAQMLLKATGLQTSFKSVDRAFRRLGITHKKNGEGRRAESGTANAVPDDGQGACD